jgi:hypothetical protein
MANAFPLHISGPEIGRMPESNFRKRPDQKNTQVLQVQTQRNARFYNPSYPFQIQLVEKLRSDLTLQDTGPGQAWQYNKTFLLQLPEFI